MRLIDGLLMKADFQLDQWELSSVLESLGCDLEHAQQILVIDGDDDSKPSGFVAHLDEAGELVATQPLEFSSELTDVSEVLEMLNQRTGQEIQW